MKRSPITRLAALALGATLLAPTLAMAQPAGGQDPSMLAMTGDLLIARPVGLVVTAAGTAAFLVSLPFTALGGNMEQAGEVLVAGPARTTFTRCLGCTTPNPKPR